MTLSEWNDFLKEIEQLKKENQELKEDNLTYKHIIGDDLFFEDLVNKYKPCYEAMNILKRLEFKRSCNCLTNVIYLDKQEYEIITKALESVEE